MAPTVRHCGKCALLIDINVDSYTVCEGRCYKSFHIKCANLREADLYVLSGNILWMCDGCLPDFHRYRAKKVTDSATETSPAASIEDEVMNLKSTVAGIVETLSGMMQKTGPIAPYSSTPVSSTRLLDGTVETLDNTNENEKTGEPPEEQRNFVLYLTRIDRCATESDVSRLVSRSLSAPASDCNNIVKLVPRWKDVNTMDYVSFKIVLNEKWKPTALLPSTWPKRIRFREFVNRLDDTWSPY